MTAARDLPTVEDMARNICDAYDRATDAELAAGIDWYPAALRYARGLADTSGYTLKQCAAVIAVLSPQKEWSVNLRIATAAVSLYAEFGTAAGCGQTAPNVRRADAALAGDLSDVAREHRTEKVHNFNRAILGDLDAVTIDRHAIRVALGDMDAFEPSGPTPAAYRVIAAAYRLAASSLGLAPRDLQAIVWIVCVNYRLGLQKATRAAGVI